MVIIAITTKAVFKWLSETENKEMANLKERKQHDEQQDAITST